MTAASDPTSTARSSRRAQIVDATIETVAELGFARTTFARIAERGGMSSTRLISYHFASKAELMQAVIDDTYRSINDFLIDRMATDPSTRPIEQPAPAPAPPQSAADELRAYILATIAYVGEHRVRMRAFQSIFAAVHDEPGNPAAIQADPRNGATRYLQDVLRRGQDRGEFRGFDPLVIATMIQRPLETLITLLQSTPELDLDTYGTEFVTAVELATRAEPGAR